MPSLALPSRLAVSTRHPHHWVIEPPEGPRSLGRCRRCGLERSFANSNEATAWGADGDEEGGDMARLQQEFAHRSHRTLLSDEAADG